MHDASAFEIAFAAVQRAAHLCQSVRQDRASQAITKSDASPVTVADFGAQALICQALQTAFPHQPIIGEEDSRMLREDEEIRRSVVQRVQGFSPEATEGEILDWIDHGNGQIADRFWTLDPIDGTKGFIRGDQYAIALAQIVEGELALGIMGCPALPFDEENMGVIFTAIAGAGAWAYRLDGTKRRPMRVNPNPDRHTMALIESVETSHSDRQKQRDLVKILGFGQDTIAMDSSAKYGMVAQGAADLYVRIPLPQYRDRPENIWDHAAGAILVTEAGGRATDLRGEPLQFGLGAKMTANTSILASNGTIHDAVLAALNF